MRFYSTGQNCKSFITVSRNISFSETLTSANSEIFCSLLVAVLMLVLIFSTVLPSQAQSFSTFTPADKFSIPDYNATISFAVNGSYSEATLENNAWSFQDLSLNYSQVRRNLEFSAENSNVTILYYRYSNDFRSEIISYSVQGQGKQTVNFDLNSSQSSPTEWMVTVPGTETLVFLAEGEGWNLLPGNTVVVTGSTSNVTVVHFSILVPVDNSNLPFYQQHSVAIVTAAAFVITVAVALVIRTKRKPNEVMPL